MGGCESSDSLGGVAVSRSAPLSKINHAHSPPLPRLGASYLAVRAVVKELTDLAKNGTFADIELPPDRKAIKSKWVLKVKFRADGTFDKNKARLVAKGFLQRLGIDFFDQPSIR